MAAHDHYKPTRPCPHPWRPRLHWTMIAFGVVVFAQTLFTGLASLLYTLLLMAAVLGIGNLIAGKSIRQQIIDEAVEEAAGVHLVVRPRWALAAIGMDAFFAVGLASSVALLFAHPHTSSVPSAGTTGVVAVVLTVVSVGFRDVAHRQATRPAKPKRLTMPAAAETA